MEKEVNEYKEFLIILKNKGFDFVVSGSVAVMIYLEKLIRSCKDIDLHTYDKSMGNKLLNEKFKFNVDVYYDDLNYQLKEGLKLIKLEKLIADKIFRSTVELKDYPRIKDLYDLQFLLTINYDESLVCKYLLDNFCCHNVHIKTKLFIEKENVRNEYIIMYNKYMKETNLYFEFDVNIIDKVLNITNKVKMV